MSYDLMVFAVEAAPNDREAFLDWYDTQSEWEEDHSYDDPAVSTPALRAWFMEMITRFPPMNGALATADLPEDESSVTDYSVGKEVIYAAFSWSKVEPAYAAMFELAGKYAVGFFDASGDRGAVWLPNGDAGLTLAHESESQAEGGGA